MVRQAFGMAPSGIAGETPKGFLQTVGVRLRAS